jgi:hypothetical protein
MEAGVAGMGFPVFGVGKLYNGSFLEWSRKSPDFRQTPKSGDFGVQKRHIPVRYVALLLNL